MLRFLTVLLVLSLGCASKPPTTNEDPETLTIVPTSGTVSGTATLYNTDTNGGSWTQTINLTSSGVTYTMSVYPKSTGYFSVNMTASAGFPVPYTFGTAAGNIPSGTYTGPSQTF